MHKISVNIEAPPKDTEKSYHRPQVFSFEMESALPLPQLQYIVQQLSAALVNSGYDAVNKEQDALLPKAR